MDRFRSTDGTLIRYMRRGSGPPLLLIHGTSADSNQWQRIMPALSRHLTVYAMIRRGYQGSEDADAYQIDREVEDIVALADSVTEGPVNILAHSYGAICAFEKTTVQLEGSAASSAGSMQSAILDASLPDGSSVVRA